MITATYAVLLTAVAVFLVRVLRGPTLADRVTGIDGLIVCGICLLIVRAMDTGGGAFLPAAVVLGLVSFISTSIVARYIEGRAQ